MATKKEAEAPKKVAKKTVSGPVKKEAVVIEKPAKEVKKTEERKLAKPALAKTVVKKADKPSGSGRKRSPAERVHGKKYNAVRQLVDRDRAYPLAEAAELVRKTSPSKFDATVELHIRLGIDPRQAEQSIRGSVSLPAGTGRDRRVMAFVPAAGQAAAKKAGADFVSDEATLKKIRDGWTGFDAAVATPDQMVEVGKLGKTLGPKGLMPNPKIGTVNDQPEKAIAAVKAGSVEFRVAKDGTAHAGIGKVSFKAEDIARNAAAYVSAIQAAKPSDVKGKFIRTVTLASTMGPGIRVEAASAGAAEAA